MRPKLLALLAFAMFCGIVVAKCTAVILNVAPTDVQADSGSVPTVTVLAVNADVPAGKKIPVENIVIYHLPEENVPYNAVTSFFDVSNSILNKNLTEGDLLFHHQFSQIENPQKEVFVPPGHRIVTVQVHGESKRDLHEFQKIRSGDRVDIQLVKKENRRSKNKESVTTILENITILDTQTEFSLDSDQERVRNKVSLLLNEEQATLVQDSQDAGKLRLFVRPDRQTVQAEQHDCPSDPISSLLEENPTPVAVVDETVNVTVAESLEEPKFVEQKWNTIGSEMSFQPIPQHFSELSQESPKVVAAPHVDSYAGQYTPTITIESSEQILPRSRQAKKGYSSFYDSGHNSGWSANPYY